MNKALLSTLSTTTLVLSFFFASAITFADNYVLHDIHSGPLASDYEPEGLKYFSDYGIKVTRGSHDNEKQGREIIMDDAKALIDLCEEDTGMDIYIRSGYRSYYLQSTTYRKYGGELSAKPGGSEHQLGLAIDIETRAYKAKRFMSEHNEVYKCFNEHAYKYGFIQTYTRGNPYGIHNEPWHWRYIGKRASRYMVEQDWKATPWKLFEEETLAYLKKSIADLRREQRLKKKLAQVALDRQIEEIEAERKEVVKKASRMKSDRLNEVDSAIKQEKRRFTISLLKG